MLLVESISWPEEVANALNLYRFEKLDNWRSGYRYWTVDDDFPEGKEVARKINELDRKKQNAFYVGFGTDGQCCSKPEQISKELATTEIERARRFKSFAKEHLRYGLSLFSQEYQHLASVTELVFASLVSNDESLASS